MGQVIYLSQPDHPAVEPASDTETPWPLLAALIDGAIANTAETRAILIGYIDNIERHLDTIEDAIDALDDAAERARLRAKGHVIRVAMREAFATLSSVEMMPLPAAARGRGDRPAQNSPTGRMPQGSLGHC